MELAASALVKLACGQPREERALAEPQRWPSVCGKHQTRRLQVQAGKVPAVTAGAESHPETDGAWQGFEGQQCWVSSLMGIKLNHTGATQGNRPASLAQPCYQGQGQSQLTGRP